MKVPLCRIEEIPEEGVLPVDFFGREALVFQSEGRPRVVMNVCMHLGGPLQLEGETFVCAWHGAAFDRRGRCVAGPARADSRLMFLPTRVEEGVLTYVYDE